MVCGTSFDNKKTSKNIFVQFKFKEKLHSIPINCVCRIPFSTSLFFGITTEESRGGRGIGLLHYFFSSGGGRVRLRRSWKFGLSVWENGRGRRSAHFAFWPVAREKRRGGKLFSPPLSPSCEAPERRRRDSLPPHSLTPLSLLENGNRIDRAPPRPLPLQLYWKGDAVWHIFWRGRNCVKLRIAIVLLPLIPDLFIYCDTVSVLGGKWNVSEKKILRCKSDGVLESGEL